MAPKHPHVVGQHHADQCGDAEECSCGNSARTGPAAGEHDARDRHAFWELVQKDGDEDQHPELGTHQKGAGNRHAIEKRMQQKPYER